MLDAKTLAIFIGAVLALLLIPGPAVLFIVARSIEQGRLAGVVSALGIGFGTIVHIVAATVGISAILVSSALAFSIVKWLGAVYLIYLGLRTLRTQETPHEVTVQPQRLVRIFRQGVMVNILNPKTALFFFAFLPQFVDAKHGSIALQVFVLGMILLILGLISDSAYAMLAGTLGNWLKTNPKFARRQRYFSGSIYILLGLTTAFMHSET